MRMNHAQQPIWKKLRSGEIDAVISANRAAFLGIAVFSGAMNVLALASSLYMLQVYDRVIPSHSLPTLITLSLLLLGLLAIYGLLDIVRGRVMSRIGVRLDRALRERVLGLVHDLPLLERKAGDGLQPVRDLDQMRGFLGGAGPIAMFDLPWMPLYLGLIYILHPLLGLLAAAGAVVLVGITLLTEALSRRHALAASESAAARQSFVEASRRNAEVIRALGMGRRLGLIWNQLSECHLADQVGGSDVTSTYGKISKVIRMVLQSAVLGLGAWLVIVDQASAGVMIAASILVTRALAPIEIAIANWRGFLMARQSYHRLSALLERMPQAPGAMPLPRPEQQLKVEGLFVAAPGQVQPIVHNVSFELAKGAGLGIIGPSASGKSSLARALVGAWQPLRGEIRLDGAELAQWNRDRLGAHIGYLPQDIELLEGTVADNISRFDVEASSDRIISAARQAGVHDMILRLSDGYETRLGENGGGLSAGQRQRVALARALYGNPFLVVLDEPNSNLDTLGDEALTRAIASVRARGGIVIVIAHRPSALAGLDQVLAMSHGQVQAFGPKQDVLRKALRPAGLGRSAPRQPVRPTISDTGIGIGRHSGPDPSPPAQDLALASRGS